MDELDRLYRRLVHNIRAGFPDYLSRPFEVSELYQSLVPYRHNRRELEIETNQDYELALMRLLSGERGYLVGDERMMKALREELEAPNPDLSAFRGYATASVQLAGDGARTLEPPMVRRPGSGEAGAAPPDVAAAAARPTLGAQPAPPARAAAPPSPAPARAKEPVARTTMPARSASPTAEATTCRYCDGPLPEGRKITFCPHCGQNLSVQHCPACGTELEIGWKFCTTCGRGVA